MEACDYGSLQSLLKTQLSEKTARFTENTVQFTENKVREILSCVLLGLESLRSVFIIHGVMLPPCCNGVDHHPRLSLPLPERRGQEWRGRKHAMC